MNKQQGIVKLIILIIVAILILSYWGINLRQVAESNTGQANFGYLAELVGKAWTSLVSLWQTQVAPHLPANWSTSLSLAKFGK